MKNFDSKHAVRNMKTDWGGVFVTHVWWRMSFYEWINEHHTLLPLLPPEPFSPVPPFTPPVTYCSLSLNSRSLLPTNVLFLVSWLLQVLKISTQIQRFTGRNDIWIRTCISSISKSGLSLYAFQFRLFIYKFLNFIFLYSWIKLHHV